MGEALSRRDGKANSRGVKLERGTRSMFVKQCKQCNQTQRNDEKDSRKSEHPTLSRSIGATPLPKDPIDSYAEEQRHMLPGRWLDLPVTIVKKQEA